MAQSLKELNKRIAANKRSKKTATQRESDIDRIADAIEKSKQPVVNVPRRYPVEYRLKVTQRSRETGAIISATITPKFSEED